MEIIKLSIGDFIIDECGPTIDVFISLNDTDFEFDYHKLYNADECRYFTTQENVMGAIDGIEEKLDKLTEADKAILAGVLTPVFYPFSSEIHESEE